MEYREVQLTLFLITLAFSLPCLISFVSTSTTFVGTYQVTSYLFEAPSSTDYTLTRTSGGNIQTYYGIYINTSLEIKSDMELTGSFEGYSASMKFEDMEDYYDTDGRLILHTSKKVLRLDGNVKSYSSRWEYGNYIGYCPTPNDIIKADIDDQWTCTYEGRYYRNGEYEETDVRRVEILVKDFPTKVVEAGTFSTVRVEEIEWEDEVLDSKDTKWRRLSDGKLVAHESYDLEDGEWNLFMKRELKSEKEVTGAPTNGLPIIPIAGAVLVVVSVVSYLTYRLLKKRKKIVEEIHRLWNLRLINRERMVKMLWEARVHKC